MNKEKLLMLMKEWLIIPFDDDLTILQLLGIINTYDKWKIEMFYIHFAPLMAQVIDGDL
mgnify:CR=1 FL=1|tara:strand:+ start:240 stop:416 length:177 start_codon:yes stop_codon:yes gene_type:complete